MRAADPLTGTLVASAAAGQGIAPGEKITVTWILTDVGALAGLGDKLWVVVDSGNAVAEADESDNADLTALNILPDLAVSIDGQDVLTFTVHNNGYLTATDVLLTARQDALTGTLLYSNTIGSIAPGSSRPLTFTLPAGNYLFVKADPDNLIAEVDESNNVSVIEIARPPVVEPRRIYLPLVLKN